MKIKIARFTVWVFLLVALFALFAELTDRALYQLDYKMCLQVPDEIRATDCRERLQP